MDISAYIPMVLEVFQDWRVIAALVVVLLSWALLRSVGVITARRPRMPTIKAPKAPKPAKAAPEPEPEVEE